MKKQKHTVVYNSTFDFRVNKGLHLQQYHQKLNIINVAKEEFVY